MQFFWITDQVNLGWFDVQWHPSQENLADYFTKHFCGKHHQEVRPWYLPKEDSPRILQQGLVLWKGVFLELEPMAILDWHPFHMYRSDSLVESNGIERSLYCFWPANLCGQQYYLECSPWSNYRDPILCRSTFVAHIDLSTVYAQTGALFWAHLFLYLSLAVCKGIINPKSVPWTRQHMGHHNCEWSAYVKIRTQSTKRQKPKTA